jgi:polar amino acid transport system permease protein
MYRSIGLNDLYFLLSATGWTILLSLIAFVFGGLLAFGVALMRISRLRILRVLAMGYIQMMQAIPLLILLLLAYYGVSAVGFNIGRLESAGISLSFFTAAFLGEIWRGCIQSVPKAQWEAAESLGLSSTARMFYVILPQAVRISMPPTVGFMVQVVKGTSLVSVLGIVELTRGGQMINNATFKPFLVFGIVGAIYFLLCFPLSKLSRYLERRFNVGRRTVEGM